MGTDHVYSHLNGDRPRLFERDLCLLINIPAVNVVCPHLTLLSVNVVCPHFMVCPHFTIPIRVEPILIHALSVLFSVPIIFQNK